MEVKLFTKHKMMRIVSIVAALGLLLFVFDLYQSIASAWPMVTEYTRSQHSLSVSDTVDIDQLTQAFQQTRGDIDRLQQNLAHFRTALKDIDIILPAIPQLLVKSSKQTIIPTETITRTRPTSRRQERRRSQQADTSAPTLAADFASAIPHLLGLTEPKTYLIIAQNSDELRATGGFMTAVGTVTVDQGKVKSLTFEDSYRIDDFSQSYPDPPPQLWDYMKAEIWVFRDANWSPDYPTAAQAMLELYYIGRNAPVDGIIAVDPAALERVVDVMAPIQVSNWPEPVTKENVLNLMRQTFAPDEGTEQSRRDWLNNRKNAIGEIVKAMQHRVEDDPESVNWFRLGQVALKVLAERHVQLWFDDVNIQSLVTERGWDGAIRSTMGDYLMVVDSNLGFNKANAIVDTQIQYEITLAQGGASRAAATVHHLNRSPVVAPCLHDPRSAEDGADYWEVIHRCYWSYLRLYTSPGSRLLEATPHAIPGEFLVSRQDEPAQVQELPSEAGKTVWGTFMLVPHGEELKTTFRYTLPETIIQETDIGQRYLLDVQKQAGTQANTLQVVINLPQGTELKRARPRPARIEGEGRLFFDLVLDVDQQVEVVYE